MVCGSSGEVVEPSGVAAEVADKGADIEGKHTYGDVVAPSGGGDKEEVGEGNEGEEKAVELSENGVEEHVTAKDSTSETPGVEHVSASPALARQLSSGIRAVPSNDDDDDSDDYYFDDNDDDYYFDDSFDANLVHDNDNDNDGFAKVSDNNRNLSLANDNNSSSGVSSTKSSESSFISSGSNNSFSSGYAGSLVNGGGKYREFESDPGKESQHKMVGIARSGSLGTVGGSPRVPVAKVSGEGDDDDDFEVEIGEEDGGEEGLYGVQSMVPRVRVLDEDVEEEEEEEEWGDALETARGDVGEGDGKVEENADVVASLSKGKYIKDSTDADVVVTESAAAQDTEDTKEPGVGGGSEQTPAIETASVDSAAAQDMEDTKEPGVGGGSEKTPAMETASVDSAAAQDMEDTKEPGLGGGSEQTPAIETASVDSAAAQDMEDTKDPGLGGGSEQTPVIEPASVDSAAAQDMEDTKEPGLGGGSEETPALETASVDSAAANNGGNSTDEGGAVMDSSNVDAASATASGGDSVNSTGEEDSVVDSRNVNASEAVTSGVVAVADSEVEGKEPKVNGTPDHGSENVKLANDFEPQIDSVGGEQQTENQMNEADTSQPVESAEQQNTEESKLKAVSQSKNQDPTSELQPVSAGGVKDRSYANVLGGLNDAASDKKHQHELVEQTDIPSPENEADADIEMVTTEKGSEESVMNEEGKLVNFGSGSSSNKIIEEELISQHHSEMSDGQAVTYSEDEGESGDEGEGPELFDSAALTALLKAATGAGSDPGNITITSQDGSRLFSVERPAGLGSSLRSVRPASSNSSFMTPLSAAPEDLSEEEKNKLQNLYQLKVKFLRLVQRVGFTAENSLASQVLYKLSLFGGRRSALPAFSVENAKQTAMLLESEGKDVLDLSLNILVLGKTGVGKSAIINSIFSEEKVKINAFEPETSSVTEICGTVDGVNIRFIDVPGLKTSAMEQGYNRKVLESVKKFTKKYPIDVMFYVDRLDSQMRDLNDLPMLRTITASLGSSIWRNTVITLTHASSAPPDGPSGTPLSYEVFVAQRSHIVQQSIGQAVGDLRLMNLNMMSPISLVENHPACRKNREGQKVLPNGQAWRPQLLVLCYSMKILSEASSFAKPQDPIIDSRKLFGFRVRSPPLPYLLSSLLQPRVHPKLPADQGGDNIDSDIDLDDLSDSDQEEEVDEYDQLPPFKPLRKSQITKLSNEQKKAYFEEYDYRVKLLQKKQWKEELKRMKQMKKGKSGVGSYAENPEIPEDYDGNGEGENGSPASVPVPLPDMVLPPSFDGDNPAYRYRFLEPTSQFLARPVLDTHGWDHDCGYDGVNVEQNLGIAGRFPVAVTAQVTKDKKDFNVHLDSAVATKHGENASSLVGFDVQSIGKQYAYIIKGESKFKNLKKNKTTAGVSVTFLGENVASGVKVEDQITLGKRVVLIGSTGTVRSQKDAAYGANVEVRLRDADYPIGQEQSSFTLSLMKWRGDLAIGGNLQSQVSVGRNSKVALRVALNNKQSGQITVKTSSSDHISLAIAGLVPIALSIYQKLMPGVTENYSIY